MIQKVTRGSRIVLFVCLWLLVSGACLGLPLSRNVVLGDIHGDFERLTWLLKRTGLMDDSRHWIGQDAILIQVGDFTDRGDRVREVMDLLMRLQSEAREAGGEVVVLLGNHEMMNIVGDLRYVSDQTYRSFSSKDSRRRQEEAYREYLSIARLIARRYRLSEPKDDEQSRLDWYRSHPLGYVEYREAMGPNGRYGKWLRDLPTVVRLGDTIFVHGGIDPSFSELSLSEINSRIEAERSRFDKLVKALEKFGIAASFFSLDEILKNAEAVYRALSVDPAGQVTAPFSIRRADTRDQETARIIAELFGIGKWLSMSADGPLWFRGYGQWSEGEGRASIEELLRRYETKHFVIGHTMKVEDRILSRFGGSVLLVDTLRASALEIREGVFTAIYADQVQRLNSAE